MPEQRETLRAAMMKHFSDKLSMDEIGNLIYDVYPAEPAGGAAAVEEEWMREAAKEIVDGAYALHCKFEIGNQREIETKGITALIAKHAASRTRALEEALLNNVDQLAVDLCRELYDRFIMGGWSPEDAHAETVHKIRQWAESLLSPSPQEGSEK